MIIPDYEAIKQIQGIRRGDSGSLKHQHGKDDMFDAICICLQLFEDAYGGFHAAQSREAREQARAKQDEFNYLFRKSMPYSSNRSRPALSTL